MKFNALTLRGQGEDAGFSPIYQAQKRDYSERYSIHEQNAKWWRRVSFGCIGIAFLAVAGNVYDALQPKYVPYVVERDRLGDEIAVGLVQRADSPDLRVIQTQIRKWIYNVRTVSPDAQTQKNMVIDAYNHTNKSSPANGELNEWFQNNSPFKRAAETIVTTTVTSALPVDPHNWKTWRANWKEETRTRSGDLVSSSLKDISITVSYKPAATESDFQKNPEGVFVDNFDWKN